MLTVGYGDIIPRNNFEISAIILLQVLGNDILILGTAINGYIFSEVGHTLSKIRYKK
jgi:hypothetical protein